MKCQVPLRVERQPRGMDYSGYKTHRSLGLPRYLLVTVLCKLPVREHPSPEHAIFAVNRPAYVGVDQQIACTDVSVHVLAFGPCQRMS